MKKALIFSIEEFSIYDGPGIRTTVFLKGCPLRCIWCHNPEGQLFSNQIYKGQSGCVNCGACLRAAKQAAGQTQLTDESISVCPHNLLRYTAEEYTSDALVQKLKKNRRILQVAGGGVTFSGGEPLSHPEFLLECLVGLEGVLHRALQTSGFCNPDIFKKILPHLDHVLYDIKLIDPLIHQQYTGVDNAWILHNFRLLCRSNVPFTVRTPLIPTITDTAENLTAIAQLLRENGVTAIELLPYNSMTGSKYASVGRTYQPMFDETIPSAPRKEIFERFGITAIVL